MLLLLATGLVNLITSHTVAGGGAIGLGLFAGVIMFLCSELASYITGQVIQVNGGWIG